MIRLKRRMRTYNVPISKETDEAWYGLKDSVLIPDIEYGGLNFANKNRDEWVNIYEREKEYKVRMESGTVDSSVESLKWWSDATK